MNRMIWIWRLIAVLILLIFAILMWNLYARLVEVKQQRGEAKPAVEEEAVEARVLWLVASS